MIIYSVEAKIMPILRMTKLTSKEVKSLAQIVQLTNGGVGTPPPPTPRCPVSSVLLGNTPPTPWGLPSFEKPILSPCGKSRLGFLTLDRTRPSPEHLGKSADSDSAGLRGGLRARVYDAMSRRAHPWSSQPADRP